ncbi:unnamed protein product [Arctia plantaginis]|uniref:Endonuclease/exonuclease/phosphatase domain-containing protein n=1 Tax=Arctia plantaginis TaxID=874455 RepID=A0A8S1BRM6_ARCPL|nr:unnamed protein product [Arctia plantaginis]
MAINETWLRPGEEGRAPSVPGYRLRHTPRPNSVRGGRGGGVGFYIKNGVKVQTRSHPLLSEVEQYWLSINIAGKKVLVGTAYRPPWMFTDKFLDGLTDSIGALAPFDHIILLGDFNINMLDGCCANTTKLQQFLHYTNMSQVVNTATHFIGNSGTLIDVICTDMTVRNIVVQP